MPTTRETVLAVLHARLRPVAALVLRDDVLPERIPVAGLIILRDGQRVDVLEHPLNAVAWLAQDLQKHGLALQRGDLVSVGSFSKLMPPKPGLKVEVQYQGLPENPSVKVNFK